MDQQLIPIEPFFLRAFYEWCLENDLTPHIGVEVDRKLDEDRVRVPWDYVKNGEITLNIGPNSCGSLEITNDVISFDARFGGQIEHIWIPVGNVKVIFARENGAMLPFTVTRPAKDEDTGPSRPGFSKV